MVTCFSLCRLCHPEVCSSEFLVFEKTWLLFLTIPQCCLHSCEESKSSASTVVVSIMVLSGDILKTKTLSCLIRDKKRYFTLTLSHLWPNNTILMLVLIYLHICRKKMWLKFSLKLVLKSNISRYLNSYLVLYLLTV